MEVCEHKCSFLSKCFISQNILCTFCLNNFELFTIFIWVFPKAKIQAFLNNYGFYVYFMFFRLLCWTECHHRVCSMFPTRQRLWELQLCNGKPFFVSEVSLQDRVNITPFLWWLNFICWHNSLHKCWSLTTGPLNRSTTFWKEGHFPHKAFDIADSKVTQYTNSTIYLWAFVNGLMCRKRKYFFM